MRRTVTTAFLWLSAASCAEGFTPLSDAPVPQELVATAMRVDAVRLRWTSVDAVDVVSYVISRRADLSGDFQPVAQVPQSSLEEVIWIDADVEPETYYGYRVVAVTAKGDRSAPSVVGGALTPPRPGIEISTRSLVTASGALDPDGYEVRITGPDTVRATIGVETRRRFSPLRPGRYTVALTGIIERCSVNGEASREVDVTDTTALTIAIVGFQLTCRDPSRGDISVQVDVVGQDRDPEFLVDIIGLADDASLPPGERTFAAQRALTLGQPAASFANLRPGVYDVTLEEVADNCVITGSATRTVTVSALGIAAVTFSVSCTGDEPQQSTAPFVWRNAWLPNSAANAAVVTLTSTLDLTTRAGQSVKGVQADLYYDPAVLNFVEEVAGQLPVITVNAGTPGRISFIASTTGAARTGLVTLASFRFTVIGTAGATTAITTQNLKAGSPAAFQDSVRVVEDTFAVATGSALNQSPSAEANGPYAGNVGTPVQLSSLGSLDGDGSIVSYQWSFGDNTSGSGASVSKTYAAAGSYTVTLTVTDDDGATDTDQATVTIAPAGTTNLAPTAEANGPYAAVAGISFALSAAGSADPNGVITSYSWSLGNGVTVTGASPTVTYAAAGTYGVTLTVTDNAGASDTDQATVIVASSPSARPLTWRNDVGPLDVGTNLVAITVSYDLRTNLAETPGAESLASFTVDSLKWDSSVLQFHSISLGPNITGGSNQSGVSGGRLRFSGTVAGAQQQGLITIATIRFRPVGPPGGSTATATWLGPLLGTSATNFFVYNSRTTTVEGTFTVP